MDTALEVVEGADRMTGPQLLAELVRSRATRFVLVTAGGVEVGPEQRTRLAEACSAPMAASASPLPSPAAQASTVATVALHPDLPPPPTLALGCDVVRVFDTDALHSVPMPATGEGWRQALHDLDQRLCEAGWRHVAAPGTALDWQHRQLPADGVWRPSVVAAIEGDANQGLATHRRWAGVQLAGISVVVDGACLTDQVHNGTQALVLDVTRALRRARPDAEIAIAVGRQFADHVRGVVGDVVTVVERVPPRQPFHVVYRPYQLLDPAELAWLSVAGHRLLLGQLDMIGFSNAAYHPSPQLFHSVRNLQRHTMRLADGVTFISAFAADTAVAECPDLDAWRRFVVGCGPGALPPADARASLPAAVTGRFVTCLSSTFWHKNRTHAIAVFAELCRRHGYTGSLVIAGPEPYYGDSRPAEDAIVASLEPELAARVIRVGQVDERAKWSLLEAADVVLYPSIVEGFGLVPFEAAAVGTPCLFRRSSALAEVVGPVVGGLDSWDAAAWAAVADRLITSDATAAAAVGEVAEAARRHTWDAVADRTWRAIDATVARPQRRPTAEEGGLRSRVATANPTARTAPARHFVSRLTAYARRLLGRLAGRRPIGKVVRLMNRGRRVAMTIPSARPGG